MNLRKLSVKDIPFIKEWMSDQSINRQFKTDFSVVRQHSSPYVWLCFQVFLLPANSPIHVRLSFRILGVSHTSGMTSTFHLRLYSIYIQIAMFHIEV